MTFFKLPPSSTPITSVFVYSLNLLGTLQAFCTNSAVSISSQATEAAVGFLIRTSFASVGPDNITTFCSGSTSLITSDIRIRVFNSKPFEALTRGVSGLIPAAFNCSQTGRTPPVATTDKIISAPSIAFFKSEVICTFLSSCTSRGLEQCLFITRSSFKSHSLPQMTISSKLSFISQANVKPQHPGPSTVNFIYYPSYI